VNNAPQSKSYPIEEESISVLFRIISRHSWDELQGWHKALPGSRVEHLMYGLYVLHVEPGAARKMAK
jgi:hypothetical protein